MFGRRIKALCVFAGVALCVYLAWLSSKDNIAEHLRIRESTDENKLFITYDIGRWRSQ